MLTTAINATIIGLFNGGDDMYKVGEWIIVHPIDCFTMVPVYQCSVCGKLTSGYDPDPKCLDCGAVNKVAKNKSVELEIFGKEY